MLVSANERGVEDAPVYQNSQNNTVSEFDVDLNDIEKTLAQLRTELGDD